MMAISKKLRIEVWEKYNRHCAYCGKEIKYKEMQVDHFEPKAFNPPIRLNISGGKVYGNPDRPENLMPSCRRCNHYKRSHTLKSFRYLIETLHERLLDIYIFKVAQDYGIITIHPFEGKFYFEKCNYQTLKTK